MSAVLQEIITLLLSGLTQFASSFGAGIKALVEGIFLDGAGTQADPYALSTFGGIIVVFAGISIAVALCRWVMMFVTSLGAKK